MDTVVLELLVHYLYNVFVLLVEIAPWMLLGFVIAAVVEEFVPTEKLVQYFGRNNATSLGRATLAGVFVSMCSCGAIPLAASLRRSGASSATALTFLLAAPWAGFAHLFIIMRFVGLVNALLLFGLSLLIAFFIVTAFLS